jgi:uncharacterized protein with GYD domain
MAMSLYLYQAAYTSTSIAAQVKNPHDRLEHARQVIEGMGGKLVGGGYSFGEYDLTAIVELPDDVAMAAFSLAVAAGGAARAARTTPLLSGAQWIAGLKKVSEVSAKYRPAG